MKKLLISIALAVGSVVASHAQDFNSRSFLNCQAIYITNSTTFVTNLASTTVSPGTNLTSTIATNLSGNAITSNTVWNVNLLRTVDRFVDRNSSYVSLGSTNSCIFVNIISAGANATNGFTCEFVAVPDGTLEDSNTTPFTCVVAANNAVSGGWRFPLPSHLFTGCKSIKLRKVYSTVAPTAAASQFVINAISLNGFVP